MCPVQLRPLLLAAAALFWSASLVPAQIRTVGGDPLLTVTDPAQAVPAGKTAKLPPLVAGETVRLVEDKGGLALVAREAPDPQNGRDRLYRLPMAALAMLPGRTHTERPSWLPAPGPAEAATRDVLAFEDGGYIMVVVGGERPRRLAKGHGAAVSPDGSRLAYSPEGEKVILLVDPAGGHPVRLATGGHVALEKYFSPDGRRLAWRANGRIELADCDNAAAPAKVIRQGLAIDQSLQGFTPDGASVIMLDLKAVTWLGLDGTTLRTASLEIFTDDPWPTSADHYLPSPAAPELMLIERGVFETPAYSRWADGPSVALYLYDAASGTNYRLTPRSIAAVEPAWTPDGRRIYFAGLPDAPAHGRHRLYRMAVDGTGLTEIARGLAPSVGTRP